MALTTTETVQGERRRRRWLLALLLLVVLPIGGVWGVLTFLRSSAGEELLKAKVLEAAQSSLAGKLELESVSLDGDHLVLRGLKLFTPEGELVASIDRVEADVDVGALASQRVQLSKVRIETPKLFLREDARGWNLSRALAAKTPSDAKSDEPDAKLLVLIDALELKGGALELHQPGRDVVTTDVEGTVKALRFSRSPLTLAGELSLTAHLTGPLDERLRIEGTAQGSSGHLTVALGQSGLRASVEAGPSGLPALTVEKLTLSPRELKAFVPDWPLRQPLLAHGTLGATTASLELSSGSARVLASARYSLEHHSVEKFELGGKDLELADVLPADVAPPASRLTFQFQGALDDWRPETLGGKLTGKASWSTKQQPLAELTVDARAKDGSISLKEVRVEGSGAALAVRGTVHQKTLALYGTVEAKDLAQLDETLHTFGGMERLGLSGTGKLQLLAKGPIRGPSLSLFGSLERLRVGETSMERVTIQGELPDVRRPLDTDVLLSAAKVHSGERTFDEVTLDFQTRGREVDLEFTTRGMGDLQAHVKGVLDANNHGAAINECELKWADNVWALEAPTTAKWGPGVLTLAPLVMHDGERRVALELDRTPKRLTASVHAERLDLARLPSMVTPTAWGLAGTVSQLDLSVEGAPSSPEVKLLAKVTKGEVLGVTGLELDVDGHWNAGRLTGRLTADSAVGKLAGDYDVPVFALRDEQPEQASAHLTLERLSSEWLSSRLERPLPFTAAISGSLLLSGTGEHPHVVVHLTAPELVFARASQQSALKPPVLSQLAVQVETLENDALMLTVDTATLGGQHHVQVRTPLTLSSLRHTPPTRDDWFSMPLGLEFESRDVVLADLLALKGEVNDELHGTATVAGSVHGTLRAPLGTTTFSLKSFALPPVRDADVSLKLVSDEERTRLTGTGALQGKPAVELSWSVLAPPERALAPLFAEGGSVDDVITALKDTKLEGLVTMAPFDLTEVLKREGREQKGVVPGGTATAALEASGTLEAPNARLLGTVSNLRFERVTLGSARFDVKVTGEEQNVTVALGGTGRDDLKLKGTTGVDVRLSALRRGLQWKKAPVQLSLIARNFDLGFLTGATESLRVVAGRLDFEGDVKGTLGAPRYVGDGALTKGRLSLAGRGDYRDIECEVFASNDVLELRKLNVSSGAGHASVTAKAERQSTGLFALTSTLETQKFPLVNDDQLLAAVTISSTVQGELSSEVIDLKNISIPRAEILLPEVKRKDLQDLQRPKDIVILRRGKKRMPRTQDPAAPSLSQEPGTHFIAVVDAPRNLWVRSSDVNLELGLSDGFRIDRDDSGVRMSGEARIMQGTLEVIGREFTVQKGSQVRFAGPPNQPYVNVTALHTNTKEGVKITVSVAGKGTDVSLKATSEPPLPESDIYAILATGRRSLKTSGGAAITPGQAASVVGQLAASQLKTVLAKKVPIDVFNFETSDNFEKVRVDVGKYIGDSLYLGATVNIGARRERGENTWAGRLEWQMSRSVTLEAYAGDALSFGADAMWSQDF